MLNSPFFLSTTKRGAETISSQGLKLLSSRNQKLGPNPQEFTDHWLSGATAQRDSVRLNGIRCGGAAGSTCSNSLASCSKVQKAQQHLPSKAREQVLTFTTGQAHAVFCREQSTGFQRSERLFRWRNRKGFGSHPLPILSSALPQCTVHRWDITFEGNQELAGFNMAALVGILLGGKAIVSESITASVS